MIYNLENKIKEISNKKSDINEHIFTMIKYGKKCEHITEMGVRGIVSTWAWLYCKPKKLICYDFVNPSKFNGNINDVYETAKYNNIDFKFYQKDVLKVEIEKTDLLFIDTKHHYEQLCQELKLHANNVNKYICFHDTTLFGHKDEYDASGKGIWPAISEFLRKNNQWILEKQYTNNNGFTIIKRIDS